MNVVTCVGKSESLVLASAMETLNASQEEMFYHIEVDKGHLLKGNKYTIYASLKIDVMEEIRNYLKEIITGLGIDVEMESKFEDEKMNIHLYSSNNNILIGKRGKTLEALRILAKQYIYSNYKYQVYILLDVEDYKEKIIKNLERLAKKTAVEVRNTKVDAILENMNSYERRIVHNALANFKGVTTSSEGEEPNRHVIIKASSK